MLGQSCAIQTFVFFWLHDILKNQGSPPKANMTASKYFMVLCASFDLFDILTPAS